MDLTTESSIITIIIKITIIPIIDNKTEILIIRHKKVRKTRTNMKQETIIMAIISKTTKEKTKISTIDHNNNSSINNIILNKEVKESIQKLKLMDKTSKLSIRNSLSKVISRLLYNKCKNKLKILKNSRNLCFQDWMILFIKNLKTDTLNKCPSKPKSLKCSLILKSSQMKK